MTRIPNSGHGHVFPRPDGVKARCGGPAICPVCAQDLGALQADQRLAQPAAVAPREPPGPRLRLVVLESPYAGDIETNLAYARAAMHDCFVRCEAPFAAHLLYPQAGILDDSVPIDRAIGIDAGLAWGQHADATVVYVDLGITRGMIRGIEAALAVDRSIEFRHLADWR